MRKLDDLQAKIPVGTVVGDLVVRGYDKYGKPPYFWLVLCECKCGKTIHERPCRLFKRTIKSCGCTLYSHAERAFKDRYPIGMEHGELTVIGHEIKPLKTTATNGSRNEYRIVCECTCGRVKSMRASAFKSKLVVSCGHVGLQHRVAASRRVWKLEPGISLMHAAYSGVRYQALWRGIEWQLTVNDFQERSDQPCHYCAESGTKICRRKHIKSVFVYNGLDRLDNTLGYSRPNCVPCCKKCNYAKHSMNVKEFKEWITRVARTFLGVH